MQQIPSDEEVCVASLADRDSVVAIDDDVYSGLDYLPATYPSLVEGPGVRGYLYKKGGRIVAFLNTQLIDGGRTVIHSTARVAPEYRESGVFGRFHRLIRSNYIGTPNICYIALTVTDITMTAIGQKLLRTYRQVTEKTITTVELTSFNFNVKVGLTTTLFPGLRTLSTDDMTSIMSCEDGRLHHLFPDGRIILDWQPYRLMAANVPLITNTCTHRVFLATDANSPPLDTGLLSVPTVLSAGSYFACSKGTQYITDLFGEGSEEELRAHITWHLLRSADVANGNVVFSIFHTRGLDDIIADLGKTFPLKKLSLSYEKLIVLEQDVCQRSNDPVSSRM
ncbi:probable N-acetyltransferase 16 [Pomacea canaliculata]|uniref:probable N-acetyltransferase 16 n=1 Tax=Pomacea canaliculata TaxID=400727 RepID=UPI000D72F86C|nr:probable N-acetyltransferase 16 [Pomacea canaliculata]